MSAEKTPGLRPPGAEKNHGGGGNSSISDSTPVPHSLPIRQDVELDVTAISEPVSWEGLDLEPRHAARLEAAAITPEAAKNAGLRSGAWGDLTGIIFPYHDADGRIVDQLRLDVPIPDEERPGKTKKYLFPKGSNPPFNYLREPTGDAGWLMVEGSKQAIAALAWAPPTLGIVGMFGCRGWSKQDLSPFAGRNVAVILDRDVTSNAEVHNAATGLHAALKGANARGLKFPTLDSGTGTDGLDDVLGRLETGRTEYITTIVKEAGTGVPALTRSAAEALQDKANEDAVRFELARRYAREVLDNREAETFELPESISLKDLLNEPDEDVPYRIRGLLPIDGRAILAAEMKAGKTTMTGNLVRCLADGGPFLDRFRVERAVGRVVIVDTEMSRNQMRRWLRNQEIINGDRVELISLRGQTDRFKVTNPKIRARWADKLRRLDAEIVIIDPINPLFIACGVDENDNTGVGAVLDALDALVKDSGASELILTHHMGHNGERSRGASKLRGWPDAEWKILTEKDGSGNTLQDGKRFFWAYGRDVDVPETQLDYDEITRRLSLSGESGNRAQRAKDRLTEKIEKIIKDNPGCLTTDITGPGIRNDTRRLLIAKLVEEGRIHVIKKGNAHHHYPGPTPAEDQDES